MRMDHLDNMVLGYLSNKLFAPDRLEVLLEGYLAQEKDGIVGRREKLHRPETHVAAWTQPWRVSWRWWRPAPWSQTTRP
jgi:hypothetical protein